MFFILPFFQVIIVGRQTDGGYNRHGAAISPNIVHFAIFLSMFPTEVLKARLGRARGPWRKAGAASAKDGLSR